MIDEGFDTVAWITVRFNSDSVILSFRFVAVSIAKILLCISAYRGRIVYSQVLCASEPSDPEALRIGWRAKGKTANRQRLK